MLSVVKTEFGKFGHVLANVKRQANTVVNSIGEAETRTRQMARALQGRRGGARAARARRCCRDRGSTTPIPTSDADD